jgi:RNA polymerase sigma factor (sigma-70 family)
VFTHRAIVKDEALMHAVRGGDVGQLGVLFDRYRAPLFDFLSRMSADRAAAEDLVQDVFVRILKYRRTYRADGCFETWMFRIARNTLADYFRKRRTLESIRDGDFDRVAPGPGPVERLERERETDRLKRALMLLADDKRELLVLARYRNMSYERIGAVLGIEIGAVKVRVHRAVKELRAIFLRLRDEERTCDAKRSGTDLRIT